MPILQYGQNIIEWRFKADAKLKRHYVTVERGNPVLLRGPTVDVTEQEALVRRRARWIRDKLALVNAPQGDEVISTGSRLRYCGRTYFTEVRHCPKLTKPLLTFTASRFVIENPLGVTIQQDVLTPLLESFYRGRAHDKLMSRVRYWERQTDMGARGVRVRHFQSRWANCNAQDVLEFHPRVMELSSNIQDYVILHELCHTVEKNHTKAFWKLLTQHMADWRRHHEALERTLYGGEV